MLNKANEQKEKTINNIKNLIEQQINCSRDQFSININVISWPEDVLEKITLWVHDNHYRTRIEDIEKSRALRYLHISWK